MFAFKRSKLNTFDKILRFFLHSPPSLRKRPLSMIFLKAKVATLVF